MIVLAEVRGQSRTPAIIFGLIGLFMLLYGGASAWRAWKSLDWPGVDGKVLDSRMAVASDADGSSYRPIVEYQYHVAGRTYIGSTISYGKSLGGLFGDEKTAQAVLDHFPKDARILVRYNPVAPEEAVLVAGLRWGDAVYIGLGLLLLIFASTTLSPSRKR
jgi:hypothetical protein